MKEFDTVKIKDSNIIGIICHMHYNIEGIPEACELELFDNNGWTIGIITIRLNRLELINDEADKTT